MSLPRGEWQMLANGHRRTLKIHAVESDGTLRAEMQNSARVKGFWSQEARKITFRRIIVEDDPEREQTFVGYLLDDPEQEATHYTLSGYYEHFGPDATAARTIYGWVAQKEKNI